MNKKLLSMILAGGIAAGMITGCGDFSDAPDTSGGGKTADGKTEVIFYHWTPVPEMELMEKTFNETHDDIHLTYKPIPDSPDAMIKMNTMLMANEPMLVFRSDKNFTLPIGLRSLLTPYGNNYDLLIVGSFFSVIPLFILFIAFQRYFLDGMTAGAVKG